MKPSIEPTEAVASSAQQRLWFMDRWQPGSAVYNIPVAYRLSGTLDVAALELSLNEIVRRHDVLRTTFASRDGVVVQRIAPSLTVPLRLVGVGETADREADLQRMVEAESRRPFDLEHGPLVRATLFRIAADDHVLSLALHHVIFDNWSHALLFRELQEIYKAYRNGSRSPLPELTIQYADYAARERERVAHPDVQRQIAYWRKQLADLPTTDLPSDRPRPRVQRNVGSSRPFVISAPLTAALKAVAQRHRATMFMVLAAGFEALLHRYTSQDDVAIGLTVAGRTSVDVENLIGCFVNTLVLRGDVTGTQTFSEFLARVRATVLGAVSNQEAPFEKLVEELQPQRDLGRSPFFQALLNMQAPAVPESHLGDLKTREYPVDLGVSRFDVTLFLGPSDATFAGRFEYDTDLFDAETIDRLGGHYLTLLAAVAADPTITIGDLPMLTAAEQRQLCEWNETAREYPRDRTVVQLFEEQAEHAPDAVAVSDGSRTLTYRQLRERATALAGELQARKIGAGALVGLCLDRSTELVVALLGVLKAGAAYLPLDPAFPAERLAFMASDAQTPLVLTQTSLHSTAVGIGREVLCIDTLDLDRADVTERAALPIAGAEDLAYVLYTSGSTGRPKGVEIEHRALTNFLWTMREKPGCTARDVLLAVTTLSFDIAGLELYLPLIAGGRVELVPRATAADGRLLRDRLAAVSPTLMQATPATWRMLIDSGWTGTSGLTALVGGEAFPPDLVEPLLERTSAVWNMYGPTETTIWSSVDQVTNAAEPITLGRPIANTTFEILDGRRQRVPVGVPGELFIGGDGVARGYRHRADLTGERFVTENATTPPMGRLYRTGDLVKRLPDGRVVYLGRLDDQVKIRGFRIELGEIESALRTAPGVAQAVVVAHQDGTRAAELAAYVVAVPGSDTDAAPLRQHLRQSLPDYMVPSHFVWMDALPLTANGKIDRRKLPAPSRDVDASPSATAPRTPTERAVAKIWSEVLEVPAVDIDADFFESGGHSLLAVMLLSRLEQEFGVALPLNVLFETPNVRQIALRFEESSRPERRGADVAVQPTARASTEPFAAPSALVVSIRPRGTKPPLFLVHDGGGNFIRFRTLASRLDPDQPVYAIRAERRDDRLGCAFEDAPNVETLAERYIAAMTSIRPTGPYRLGGFCFGGVIAFEMARQLRARGEGIDGPLLLIDASFGEQAMDFAPRTIRTVAYAEQSVRRLESPRGVSWHILLLKMIRDPRHTMQVAVAAAQVLRERIASSALADDLRRLAARFFGRATTPEEEEQRLGERFLKATFTLLGRYKPGPYDGAAVFFHSEITKNQTEDWRRLTSHLSTHLMPGGHLDMMEEPGIDDTAAIVDGYFRPDEAWAASRAS